jgi:hypothetical protein
LGQHGGVFGFREEFAEGLELAPPPGQIGMQSLCGSGILPHIRSGGLLLEIAQLCLARCEVKDDPSVLALD